MVKHKIKPHGKKCTNNSLQYEIFLERAKPFSMTLYALHDPVVRFIIRISLNLNKTFKNQENVKDWG